MSTWVRACQVARRGGIGVPPTAADTDVIARSAGREKQRRGTEDAAEHQVKNAAGRGSGADGLQESPGVHVPGEGLNPVQQVDACQADEAGDDSGE